MSKLFVSSSPHIRSKRTTQKIMLDVIIGLIPAAFISVILFGFNALLLIAVSVLTCVLTEFICRKVMKRENTVSDLSAVVTGLLLALNMPASSDYTNLLIAVFGGVTAIVVIKQMFGGIGQNFVNPALGARIVLLVSFPTVMTTWVKPFFYLSGQDAITCATPLASSDGISYLDLFLGNTGGCIGETCGAALILGGIYLVMQRIISPIIPVTYILTAGLMAFATGQDPIYHILSGGLLLGAIFMATDYTTSPMTNWGKVIFAAGCGILTILIRVYANLPEGVSFSIVIMNILVPHIENLTRPRPFGFEKKGDKK